MTDNYHDPEVEEFLRRHDLLSLFQEQSFTERVRRIAAGLKAPRESGEYKYAKLQVIRLSAPLAAVVVPILAIGALVVFAKLRPPPARAVEVQIMEPEAVDQLEEIEELQNEPLEPPEPIDMEFTPDVVINDTTVAPSPTTELSPQPAQFDSVAIVKSPIIMRGIFGSRNPGSRGSALKEFGGSGVTEGAVLRALRWLKREQNPDGSWNNCKPAMTSLALLTFLAHGETPASDEFGITVEKAIKWLVDNQTADGRFNGRDGHDYSQPICAYALSEAFALTKVPVIREAATRAIMVVINGQNPTGGFNYNLIPTPERDDTSYMGWCGQALKAAKMAGLEAEGLDRASRDAIRGFQKNAAPEGGFGYASPGRSGLTGVGVLCMQLLGASKMVECRKGLETLDAATFIWDEEGKGTFNQNYYWYYITQAKFHSGGDTWKRWNNLFSPVLVKNQTIIEKAIEGPDGELVDIGWWDMPKELSGHTDGPTMNTALCALQLQVYYRYLPTYRPPKDLEEEVTTADATDDIDVQINL